MFISYVKKTFILIALIFSLVHCAGFNQQQSLLPAPAPQTQTPQAEVAGIKIWANSDLFAGAPIDIQGWVLPIGVDIENTSDQPVEFRLEDIRLVDDQNKKTAPFFMPVVVTIPFSVDTLKKSMKNRPPSTDDSGNQSSVFITNVRAARASGSDKWFDETGLATPPPTRWSEEVRFVGAPRDIALRSLYDRTIAPHSRTHGFLFFPRLRGPIKKAWLMWNTQGQTIRINFDVITK